MSLRNDFRRAILKPIQIIQHESQNLSNQPTTDGSPLTAAKAAEKHYDILIAEDSFPERVRLVAILHKLGYTLKEVNNGAEAIEWLQKADFSLVLTDWHMPIMSGLELCKSIKELEDASPYVLLLTGRTSICDLVSAMDSGADDYLVKPFNSEELRVRIQAGLRIVEMRNKLTIQNQEILQSYQREHALNEALQDDLKAATRLQKSTLPKTDQTINNVSCAFYFKPALGVAGDSFSVIPLGKQHICFYQIDVVGHGVRAAMLSYAVSRYLKEHSRTPPTGPNSVQMHRPEKVLEALNKEFICNDDCDDYFTIVYGVMDTKSGKGRLAQAGHPHPKLIDRNGRIVDIGCGGLPIGLFAEVKFEAENFKLEPDSKLVLYSDGILECTTDKEEPLSNKELNNLFSSLSESEPAQIQSLLQIKVDKLLSGSSPSDDISILFLQRKILKRSN
jgi:phosphoserine phosphatase RsbU/P